MGYIRHHAFVVTSFSEKIIKEAHAKALGLFGLDRVTTVMVSPSNAYHSFFVGSDGSKEGWPESDRGDELRAAFIKWLRTQYHEDGSSSIQWAEVQYGDDENEAEICAGSDDDSKYFYENYEENENGYWEPKAKRGN